MSMTDKLAELSELLVGLGVAAVVLVLGAFLFGMHSENTPNRTSKKKAPPVAPPKDKRKTALPAVAALFIAPSAGQPMERVDGVDAIAGRGLVGDRYFLEKGHWSGTDGCEVTIIAQEDIDEIERLSDIQVKNGEHRRNIVSCNLPLDALIGKRFFIGSAFFGYERPRPPCAYIQMITEPGMAKALGRHAGICVRCIKSGAIQEGDQIKISQVTLLQALKYRVDVILQRWQLKKQGHG